MKKMLFIVMAFLLPSCTLSVTTAHSQGTASDLVDETLSNTPSTTVSPTLSAQK